MQKRKRKQTKKQLKSFSTCELCGSELEFQTQANFLQQIVEVKTTCSSCQLPTKTKTFDLQ